MTHDERDPQPEPETRDDPCGDTTPRCGQLKGAHSCQRTWFHEGDHLARNGVSWGPDDSDDLGWTAQLGLTRPLTPKELIGGIQSGRIRRERESRNTPALRNELWLRRHLDPFGVRHTVRLFHRTTDAAARCILQDGFRDGEGYYLTDRLHHGVWLSDVPLDVNEGAQGDVLLAIDVPVDVLTQWAAKYEWVYEERPRGYREFLVPAVFVNRYPCVINPEEE